MKIQIPQPINEFNQRREIMKKNDIIKIMAEKRNISLKETAEIFDTLIETIKDGIVNDGIVDIYGFGKITVDNVTEKNKVYTVGHLKGQAYTSPAHKKVKMRFS